jgi:hypothetical protein
VWVSTVGAGALIVAGTVGIAEIAGDFVNDAVTAEPGVTLEPTSPTFDPQRPFPRIKRSTQQATATPSTVQPMPTRAVPAPVPRPRAPAPSTATVTVTTSETVEPTAESTATPEPTASPEPTETPPLDPPVEVIEDVTGGDPP